MTNHRLRGRALAAAAAIVLAAGVLVGVLSGGSTGKAASLEKTTTGMSVGGSTGTSSMPMPKAMPIRRLAQATWQGMRIDVRSMAPATFAIFSGSKERVVRPTKKDSIHLMVVLADAHTGSRIPYASVWVTIRKHGKIVYDERQWPMLSRYMGTHYGNNVPLPGPGTYEISLLISPPQAARHVEYEHVWLKPHRVNLSFHWQGR